MASKRANCCGQQRAALIVHERLYPFVLLGEDSVHPHHDRRIQSNPAKLDAAGGA
jgi:hypothetical protein